MKPLVILRPRSLIKSLGKKESKFEPAIVFGVSISME